MYDQLLTELKELRSRTARFRRVALHLHSPDSHDWARAARDAKRSDRSRFDGDEGLTTFAGELREHLDLVAVTDHMRSDFACQLSRKQETSDDFMVLPGMEVNFRLAPPIGFARIHLLTILPQGATLETFARLFEGQAHIPDDAERNGKDEEVQGLTLKEWVERVHGQGGLCIAAHLENEQGLRCRFRQVAKETLNIFYEDVDGKVEQENAVPENLKEYILSSKLDAVEIHKTGDVRHYRWISEKDGEKKWVACTLTFDAHNIEQFALAERVTHIKMTKLGLDGLRQALQFPDTRIRFHDSLPSLPNPRLLGIQISGAEDSFFEDLTVAFAENLTCLIGVRGSGKSSLVEALRYVFGYNRSLRELDKLEDPILELQRANLSGSIIRVAYQTTSGEVRILSATYDEKSDYVTKVQTPSGEPLEIADVETSGDYPLRLFGWSEIEILGREAAKQRDLLDRLIPELVPVLAKRDELRAQLVENRGTLEKHIQAVKGAFGHNSEEIRRYKEYKADFEKQNTEEVRELFEALDLVRDKERVLSQVAINTKTLAKRLDSPESFTLQQELEGMLEKGSQILRDWWHEEELQRLNIRTTELDVGRTLEQARARLATFSALAQEHQRGLESTRTEVEAELRARFAADDSMQRIADLRENAEKRLRQVSATRERYQKAWNGLMAAIDERVTVAKELVSTQNEITGIRAQRNATVENRLNQFLPDWMQVAIQLQAGRDTDAFGEAVYRIFGARGNQRKRVREACQQSTNPVAFADMILSKDFSTLVGEWEFTQDDAEFCVAETQPFEHDEHADVDTLADGASRLNSILDLQETHWDDHETILLNGTPVNEKSPGQRSSAMLPLIALTETTPLVIDQPEDNLDKRLIGTVLMNVLAELKEQRQIIVCTHDPNILVGGDAEQVVVLEAESDKKGRVIQHGSIDNEDIVETVLDILEGGPEAFKTRQLRYAGHVNS